MREHYLMYNGGYPKKPVFTDKNGEEYIVDWFIPVRRGKGRSIEKTLELLREDDGVIPEWLIPFADEDGGEISSVSASEDPTLALSIITITSLNTARTRRSISPIWQSLSQRLSML